jgi:hypothetical protein
LEAALVGGLAFDFHFHRIDPLRRQRYHVTIASALAMRKGQAGWLAYLSAFVAT